VSVQSDGCAPIVRAFEAGERFAEPFANAHTVASGLRVPAAVGDFMILDAIRGSGGTAIAADERRLMEWLRLASSMEGIPICPEAAACVGALEELTSKGWIKPEEQVVVFNTGAAQKYVEAIRCELPRIDLKQTIDWNRIEAGA
jgi:threonine synthase